MTGRTGQRVDRWLWFARFFKTRSAAARLVGAGRVRIGTGGATRRMAKPSQAVSEGDVLTFPQGRRIRVVRILALGSRRGSAPEAATLFEDLAGQDNGGSVAPGATGGAREE